LQLFREIRGALEIEFGDIGEEKTVMFDFEVAALNAIQIVFPEWTVHTCFFHYVKAVKDQAKKKKVPKALRTSDEYKVWINEIFGNFKINYFTYFKYFRIRLPTN
jgi:hypothetical protein